MEKYNLTNNNIENYIPINITKPVWGYVPKEESVQFQLREHTYDGINNIANTQTVFTPDEVNERRNYGGGIQNIPVNTANYATDYVGVGGYNVPFNPEDNKVDFKLIDLQTTTFQTIQNSNIEQYAIDLYLPGDANKKLINLFNGAQALRIPVNRFDDTSGGDPVPKYGKYFIKISPKYIEATVSSLVWRKHVKWSIMDTSDPQGRRMLVKANNNAFLNTVWQFEQFPLQRGRLHASIVEIWNNTKTIKKQTKIMMEDALNLNITNGEAAFVLSPDHMGYDPASQIVAPGDILRIYPRESYFNPVYIEVDYSNNINTIEALSRYLRNDAVRNLNNGIIEIYDDAGVQTDSQGNISGQVIEAYQISLEGEKEVKRKLNI
jgi:hypothetical protein